jgi:hypothetical protein
MLCIESSTQDVFIQNHLSGQTHIGLSKADINGPFAWFEGCESYYTNWNEHQPNNHDGNEYYVMMKAENGNWFDYPDAENYCACEYTLVDPVNDDYIPPDHDDEGDDDGGGSSVVGIVVGVIFFVVLFGTMIYCCVRYCCLGQQGVSGKF